MIINRVWAMPNKWTFSIKPIKELVDRYVGDGKGWVDPFAGKNSPAEITNDLNPEMPAKYHLDAVEFCKQLNGKYTGVIYDPPYSLRQIIECYKGFGLTIDKKYATTKFYTDVKRLLAPMVEIGGYAISCGWNSIGFGKTRGFEIIEILLISHGRLHNDTIVTVEKKISHEKNLNGISNKNTKNPYNLNLEVPDHSEIKKNEVFTMTYEYTVEFHKYIKSIFFDELDCTKNGKVVGKCRIINAKHDRNGTKIWFKIVSVEGKK